MFRTSVIKSFSLQSMQRSSQNIYKKRLLGKYGNEYGPLHDMPDFLTLESKQPEPTPKQLRWMKKREAFVKRVIRLCVEADRLAVKNANRPTSIKKHRNRDVDFYFEAIEAKKRGENSLANLILPEKEREKHWKLL